MERNSGWWRWFIIEVLEECWPRGFGQREECVRIATGRRWALPSWTISSSLYLGISIVRGSSYDGCTGSYVHCIVISIVMSISGVSTFWPWIAIPSQQACFFTAKAPNRKPEYSRCRMNHYHDTVTSTRTVQSCRWGVYDLENYKDGGSGDPLTP